MATETTVPAAQLREQGDALALLLSLTQEVGHLPAAYLRTHRPMHGIASWIGIQLDSPQDFEQWRTALELAPPDVELRSTHDYVWLQVEGMFRGTKVLLTGFNVPLTHEQNVPQAEASAVAA
ncbi:hypothetical protein ACFYOF_16560 [Streptomyces sp. NPDC007148]|uniref:hypothetical protein n=1 Tax=Streptomyces sp. NPDC007148 TaxID=3364775 RepID=UPI003674DAF3